MQLIFPVAGRDRPRVRHVPDVKSMAAQAMLEGAKWRQVNWRKGTKGWLTARFAPKRVRIADGAPQQSIRRVPSKSPEMNPAGRRTSLEWRRAMSCGPHNWLTPFEPREYGSTTDEIAAIAATHAWQGNCVDKPWSRLLHDNQIGARLAHRLLHPRRGREMPSPVMSTDFYNPVRRHSALDYVSPAQFERTAAR